MNFHIKELQYITDLKNTFLPPLVFLLARSLMKQFSTDVRFLTLISCTFEERVRHLVCECERTFLFRSSQVGVKQASGLSALHNVSSNP